LNVGPNVFFSSYAPNFVHWTDRILRSLVHCLCLLKTKYSFYTIVLKIKTITFSSHRVPNFNVIINSIPSENIPRLTLRNRFTVNNIRVNVSFSTLKWLT
jgi:hypothetical protein